MKDKAVVTGGAGFIGSHLTERLLKEGLSVTVIDNISTGRLLNLEGLRRHPRLKVVMADINDRKKIAKYFRGADYVFHLAALADIVPSIVDPEGYFRSNVDGTMSVMQIVRHECPKLKKFVYAASSSCYGIPDKCPTPETAEIRPEYPYAFTKYAGEQIALHWSRVYKIPLISLRMFNVYGPKSRTSGTYGAVFGVFLAQKLAGRPFTVVGDGKQTRDFTFVTDVVEAHLAAARSKITGEIFNVGSDRTYSVNRLIQLLGGKKVHIPKRPGEPDCTYADISKIKKALKWRPKVPLELGIKILLENIDYWRNAPVWTPSSIRTATKDWFKYLSR